MLRGFVTRGVMVLVGVIGLQGTLQAQEGPPVNAAPVIGTIPDVIIGDAEGGSQSNVFVFPDAFNIESRGVDDNTTPGQILWSYIAPGEAPPGIIRINGRSPISSESDAEDPGHDLTASDADPGSEDTNPATLTFRNAFYSPIGGTNVEPGAVGNGSTSTLTLFASDGTTHSSKSIMVYTRNEGSDELVGGGGLPPYVAIFNFSTGVNGWTTFDLLPEVSQGVSWPTAGAICVEVAAEGTNLAGWRSEGTNDMNADYGMGGYSIDYVASNVYHARIDATSNAALNTQPAWDFVYETASVLYGGGYIFHDNNGGANSVNTRGNFHVWFAPAASETPQFKTALAALTSADKNFRLNLRVLDDAEGDYDAVNDAGQICWTNLLLERAPYSSRTVGEQVYNVTNFVEASTDTLNSGWNVYDVLNNAHASFGGGAITLDPTSAISGADMMYVELRPGNGSYLKGDYDTVAGLAAQTDDYPIAWEADTLYQVTASLVAPTAADAATPPDFFFLGADTATNELIATNYSTANFASLGSPGMPNPGEPQEYIAFWHSHNAGALDNPELRRFRPRLDVGASGNFVNVENSGAFRMTAIRVEKVSFQ